MVQIKTMRDAAWKGIHHGGSVDRTNGRSRCQVIITSYNCTNQDSV